ncbi:putative ATPase, AAA-type [Gottschalkia acidurici 9a]|uniref:ATPase, AAA-type n=1 Tax=Gottschalkia acidurici (strain ATCC 7906 / DSM 604 / BCRC 14475 / CIP 104303 / KCTC 5404 / NCIMB 10678 / 9a) TaxID=1128398 RepID=K0AWB7_GOTA9|nr:AAA family ATPase [Gottschalkia acidurici]AFS78148.1 putative ATPase, AAA-type [Gottschalkia acidurici 9a]
MRLLNNDRYLRQIELCRDKISSFSDYPFSLDSVKNLFNIELHPKVTFIIGENGTGKSTILEAIAVSYGFNPEGGTKNFNFSTKETHSDLHEYIRLIKGIRKPKGGFFLRAESFYNLATNVDNIGAISSYGGKSLHNQSHGESFFSVFINRFIGNGLYILDEPEAALSPSRQMAMLSRINHLVKENSQFIIATHSPILMAYPDSIIYELNEYGFNKIKYEDTEHYQITKAFLNNTENMLNILLNDEDNY